MERAGSAGARFREAAYLYRIAKAKLSLCGAAATAAADARVGVALFHLEGVATAARGARVRVVDREARSLDGVDIVDLGSLQIGRAERVDHDLDAVQLELEIALGRAAVEPEPVLEAGAAAALDRDTQNADVVSSAISCLIFTAAASVTASAAATLS